MLIYHLNHQLPNHQSPFSSPEGSAAREYVEIMLPLLIRQKKKKKKNSLCFDCIARHSVRLRSRCGEDANLCPRGVANTETVLAEL